MAVAEFRQVILGQVLYGGDDLSGAEWDRFYKEIAVGSGFGLRLDFSYFVFRTDFGFKLRDPAPVKDQSNWAVHLAIGYPF